ncbi:ATP-dependent Clp protease ATP-binding subunit [Pueribacillus theae]|uniref:ATP-dependent Clp protease ATP-binding subunit n=1 Tax=Pueribacillus theae TaxID=2171751 RepID=A0A2U1JSQ4_9BACI|nr:ATP-dependent Clp protease ATP-binding subunit [Pueribacillus theae]PWA08045.1 ATP-dependent Clp protease ATP-binding subunit [Pueribacillus theae]
MTKRCEKCNTNEATVRMRVGINGQLQEFHLCQECFLSVQNEMKNPTGFSSMHHHFDFNNAFQGFMQGKGPQVTQQVKEERKGLLDELGHNLMDSAREGRIDPVIGREQEIDRVIEILNRRNKNNPVLIGEPGVGKTAIAEGLALKIIQGQVPTKLLNKEVYILDVASLVANTGIRGQFEERMKQLIKELQSRENVILFVDEIHLIVGAGSAEGSMDAGNILKPALARGDLQLIGATTLKEYRQIEKDAALERRLQPVIVKEPSVEATLEILKGLQPKYEQYHEIKYTDEAIRACAMLSHRYIQDRFLPDKAIDLLDEAGSRKNLAQSAGDRGKMEARLQEIVKEKEKAASEEDYERAAYLRTEELRLQEEMKKAGENNQEKVEVEDIQQILEEKTGIPVTKLQEDEQVKMKNLESNLADRVIGQKEAVEKVAKAIRRSRAGLKAKTRPIGSFLFVGPTGVGKTELTKVLAEELFGSKDALIRLDMSEYMEKHSVSKLIGSPPGYVGHEEAGQLTEKVRRNPYSIILLDEIEKAHPDVQHMFLQIMEDGRLTDSQGRTVSFKDTVIIMTSNAGTGVREAKVGFNAEQSDAVTDLESLTPYFKPEFLNRFDSIIQFNPLKEEDMIKIVSLMLDELNETLKEDGKTIEVSDEAKEKLASLGYDPRFGARPLRRVIQEKVEDGIADLFIDEQDVEKIKVDVEDNEIVVKKQA